MTEARIIDAVRTPRGIGRVGKNALADLHPQHLGATVRHAPAERNAFDTAEIDIDRREINEAFAVVAETFIRDLRLDRDKVNVDGGAMVLGHPSGATGSSRSARCWTSPSGATRSGGS